MTIADHHRLVPAKENPVRSATSTPFKGRKKDLPFVWLLGLKKTADAVEGAEQRTNDYYDEEIHQSVPRGRWFRQLIVGVKSSDLTRHKFSDRGRARARLQVNGGIRQNAKFTPVRTMPKLLFGPSTTFQLKSFIQPICGVRRTSMPPPNCPIAFVSESPERVRDSLKSSGPPAGPGSRGTATRCVLSPPPKMPPPPANRYGAKRVQGIG